MTSQLSAALRAAAAGIRPDEAGTGLIISHGVFLHRDDFTRHVETAPGISADFRVGRSAQLRQ